MSARFRLVDAVRGFALLIMFAYHFAFDLDLMGAAHVELRAPFWLGYRALILTLFLGLVGVGLSLAGRATPSAWRLLRLAACAAAVSAGTRYLFGISWVYFGILHFVALASLVAPPLIRYPRASALLGAGFLAGPWLWWGQPGGIAAAVGLGEPPPFTIDFVPIFPWLGVVLLGIWLGSRLPRDAAWLRAGDPRLAALGRHSLLLYMAHQGALIPLAWLVAKLLR